MKFIHQRNAPSVENLVKYLKVDTDTAHRIREIIHEWKNPINALRTIDKNGFFASYGVIDFVINPYAVGSEWKDNVPFSYINTGDTYSSTLIAKDNRIFISCWGNEYERLGIKENRQ